MFLEILYLGPAYIVRGLGSLKVLTLDTYACLLYVCSTYICIYKERCLFMCLFDLMSIDSELH